MPPHSSNHRSATTNPRSPPASTGATPPSSIPDNRLGLSPSDVATLRQHQQLAHAQARSPAGSQASSQGRLLLDPGSLGLLARHFDAVMRAIQGRLEQLNTATERATTAQYDRAGNAIQMADAEIARFRAILKNIDELELEFEKIKRIRDIVRGFRARVEGLERRMG
ncbi:hypothetical protein TI39_contig5886g00008 [Zymoseptoria brevis]|uniref:Biogenesis of lysosome-related organelles complex 1 subunit CNL1 n=1 Tax=Zymoseptoria brevis TaxID=1047168 RepID=A0A0F4G7K6_9PEZI|nr:hypothetical protein TI39_contig5886g00008 [Zymoseptoria brevis]